uniref:AAA family ATPase n=1 Tax=Ornithinicoccus halotolerans TaxID=1748220 RepID=UPI00129705EF
PAPGGVWAIDVVDGEEPVRRAAAQLLAGVVLVADAAEARAVRSRDPALTAVTAQGDVYGPGWVRGGSASAPSLLEVEAALTAAQEELAEVTARQERASFALSAATEELTGREAEAEETLGRLHENDARMAAVAEKLGQLGSTARSARSEQERTTAAIAQARSQLEQRQAELAELQQRLGDAEHEEPEDAEPSTDERERLAEAAARARSRETEVRLGLRTHEERARALQGRADSLEAAARNELAARERAAARRRRREQESAVAAAVAEAAQYLVGQVERLLVESRAERDRAREAQQRREAGLATARGQVTEASEELRELTDSVHRDEVARAEQRLRIEALQTKAVEELGVDPEVLVEEYGPDQPVPPVTAGDAAADQDGEGETEPEPEGVPFVRQEQEKRLRKAERRLSSLGKVNPLALEEYAALEERHKFLTEQLEDLRRSKEDLLGIVKEVDERVQRAFAEAFEDTAEQFRRVFDRLFPGGEGRLTLTDPDDMLTTGIEVEARPPGKKIKRLSLLSGGERSLTAVALLVAIFKARPSPFYIMDEVEAALDDTNLGRLLTLFEELRDASQLIVITHQKRTMEVADALYGVSMRGDGITTVVSQRMRDLQPQPA